MAQSAKVRRLNAAESVPARERPGFGGAEPPVPPVRRTPPAIENARLAIMMLIGAEAMFFAGLIGAFIVFRVGSPVWPPPFQPRLPVGVTGVNTIILLASAFTVRRSVSAARSGDGARLRRALVLTAVLGGTFLAVQGYEWARLIHFGLTVSSSVYGGLFYTLIGFHAAHVVAALVWLLVVLGLARRGRFSRERHTGLAICATYWIFVVALWPVLYGLIYLL
ncbi:MAG TPA: cytochrome c oxidase subunit 3 [candidate division Zixibacteria bacterium]|nr:cytochrome c oxidase subunit 3 [candidate division Zixibacteria bacterium]